MARNGKIARLSHAIREDLNARLLNGELGTKLVEWLNALPDVQRVLDERFEGRSINEQNLTEWRQGGFEEWRRLQETRDWLEHMREQAADLKDVVDSASAADWLSASMAVSLGRCFQAAMAEGVDNPYKRRMILNVVHEIGQLRRRDHEAARFRFDQERWQAKEARENAKQEAQPTPPKRPSREHVEREASGATAEKWHRHPACDSTPESRAAAPTVSTNDVPAAQPPQVAAATAPPSALDHAPAGQPPHHPQPQSKSGQIKPNQPPVNQFLNHPPSSPTISISTIGPIRPISPTATPVPTADAPPTQPRPTPHDQG